MARTGTTIEQVKQAIRVIEERGETATMIAIRQEIGGGSMTTISDHLKTLRQAKENTAPSIQVEIPDVLRKMMSEVLTSIWQKANEIASADVEVIRKMTTDQVAALEIDLREAHEGMRVLDGELSQCQDDLEKAIVQLEEARKENLRSEARLAELRSLHRETEKLFDQYVKRIEGVLLKASCTNGRTG